MRQPRITIQCPNCHSLIPTMASQLPKRWGCKACGHVVPAGELSTHIGPAIRPYYLKVARLF